MSSPLRALSIVLGLSASVALQAQDFSGIEISVQDLGSDVYLLQGQGGNIGVSTGPDGVFMVDDQFAPLSEKIMAAIAELSDKPVSYVINTHWHGDHTGGNEDFGKTGAVIVAHDNVRERMSTTQFMEAFGREVPASPDTALPVVTFSDSVNFHFNDQRISVMHMPVSHTDGDSFVHFTDANVLHMGDTFFNGFFPFIDHSSGGTLDGLIVTIEKALELVDGDTRIIPGHGPLSDRDGLIVYRDMLQSVKAAMQPHLDAGKSREDIIAANPLAEIGKTWGRGFMKTDVFTGILVDIASAR